MAIHLTPAQYEQLKSHPAIQKKILEDGLKVISKETALESVPKAPSIWSRVKSTWMDAESFVSAVKSRGLAATAAQVIGLNDNSGKRVSDEAYQQRKESCLSCVNLKTSDGLKFCGACGCGKNELAVIEDAENPERYTKLLYPELKCPIGRAGFSNAYELSIVMTSLNDNEEANLTVKSIRDTAPADVEIIAVDDASDVPLVVYDKTVKVVRNAVRAGVGKARHIGARVAAKKHLLIIDAHMRFEPGWFEKAMVNVVPNPKTLWCAACLGLDATNMDITKPCGVYTGARLVFLETDQFNRATIFDAKWQEDKPGDNYEISSVMGACYFIHRDWFFHIGGLESLRMYGSDEPFLSVKSWLAGGEVRLMKSVRVGHKFRSFTPYRTQIADITYNRLRPLKAMFPDNVYQFLASKLGKDPDTLLAFKRLEADSESIAAERALYQKIFVRDLDWLCDKFNLDRPWKQ